MAGAYEYDEIQDDDGMPLAIVIVGKGDLDRPASVTLDREDRTTDDRLRTWGLDTRYTRCRAQDADRRDQHPLDFVAENAPEDHACRCRKSVAAMFPALRSDGSVGTFCRR
jgi:hypothetical protein